MSEPCHDCRLWKSSQTGNGLYSCNKMMGVGNPEAEIMFVGDWPGDEELKTKIPFTGLMGQLLKRSATSVGISSEQCFYTHLCRCKPSFDKPPTKLEMNTCVKYLVEEIKRIRPKVIVALGGNVAVTLGVKGAITQIHGQVVDYEVDDYKGKIIPINHPAYINNFVEQSKQRKEWIQDLGKVLRVVKGEEGPVQKEVNYRVAKTPQDVNEIIEILLKAEWISYDCETTGFDCFRDKILLTSFSDEAGKGYVIPYQYPGIFNEEEQAAIKIQLGRVLGSPNVKKIMQNGKFDIQFLFANNIPIKMFAFDTCLAHYLLDENSRHGLDAIVPTFTDMGSYKDGVTDYFTGKVKVVIQGCSCTKDEEGKVTWRDIVGTVITENQAHKVATILDCPFDIFAEYAAKDADATFRLFKAFWPLLEQENLLKLLVQVVTPLSFVLANMEFTGIEGDLNYVQTTSSQFKNEMRATGEAIANSPQVKKYLEKYNNSKKITKMGVKKAGFDFDSVCTYLKEKKWLNEECLVTSTFDELDAEFKEKHPSASPEQFEQLEDLLYESVGKFNINSPLQKSRLLFEVMGLEPTKVNRPTDKQRLEGKSKGNPSTDSEALELLLKQNKIKLLEDIIGYGKIKKYQEYMLEYERLLVGSPDGRIHTSFNQNSTKTGRLSSSHPNLQNIPKHDEKKAKLIRTSFIAREGYSLLEIDYSQIEFRIWGHCSNDEKLLASLNDGSADIHFQVASQVYKVPIDKVTKLQRSTAKQVVYGLMYGMSNYSLAREYGMEEGEVNRFVNGFFSTFPKASNWMDENIAKMEKDGYLTNWVGRRRRAVDIHSKLKELKAAAQRQARNFPLQSGAADLIYTAMIKTFKMLQDYTDCAKMLLQVHDSLIFEVKDSMVKEVTPKIQFAMETAVPMKCATLVGIEIGKTLGDMKAFRMKDGVVEVAYTKDQNKNDIFEPASLYNKELATI
jgi:uracil-DNA glycosylase family 4